MLERLRKSDIVSIASFIPDDCVISSLRCRSRKIMVDIYGKKVVVVGIRIVTIMQAIMRALYEIKQVLIQTGTDTL